MASRASTHRAEWGDTPGSPKRPGLRITRGQHHLFVPDDELFNVANQIADHLDSLRNTTPRKAAS